MEPTPEHWIRLLNGSYSEQDEEMLRSWLAEDEANLGIWENYQQLWQSYGEFAAAFIRQNPPRPALAWQRLREDMEEPATAPPIRRLALPLRAVAAVAALLMALGGGLWLWGQQNEYLVVAEGSVLRHTLPDGSTATLRPGSSLRYGRQFNRKHRKLQLEGESFFEVQRNENLAFIVQGNAGAVEVLGTSFLVEAGSKDSLLLTVYTGVTALSAKELPQERTRVAANESAVITPQGVAARRFRAGRLAWKTGRLQHKATPLAEVISDLEHWYGLPIQCANGELLQCQTTIVLEDERPAAALAAIAAIFDLEVEALGQDGFLLKGGRCNQ